MTTFEQLGLSQEALAALAEVGFSAPTEIQSKTIGIIAERKDLIASAQTGSGKTAAYALPIIDILRASEKTTGRAQTKALVIVPTRELALQVCGEFVRFSGGTKLNVAVLYGGTGYRKQVRDLHRGADVIVATPGRLLDCLNRNYANLSKVQVVVLDEADRLLDMGFMPQVRAVIARVPKQRQTLMFSATIDARMKKIAEEFLTEPQIVSANQQKVEPSSIEQQFHYLKESEKEGKLLDLLMTAENGSVLVFTKTRYKASLLAGKLKELSVMAEEIHGDISQAQRIRTLTRFRAGEFKILIATDVAARGLDIPAITHVINYDLPMAAEDYVHRIGRTGRAGKSGIAHSFVSRDQKHLVPAIHRVLKKDGDQARSSSENEKVVELSSRAAVEYAERIVNRSAFSDRDGMRDRNSRNGSSSDSRGPRARKRAGVARSGQGASYAHSAGKRQSQGTNRDYFADRQGQERGERDSRPARTRSSNLDRKPANQGDQNLKLEQADWEVLFGREGGSKSGASSRKGQEGGSQSRGQGRSAGSNRKQSNGSSSPQSKWRSGTGEHRERSSSEQERGYGKKARPGKSSKFGKPASRGQAFASAGREGGPRFGSGNARRKKSR